MRYCVALWAFFFLFSSNKVYSQLVSTFAGTGSSSYSGNGVPATVAGIPNPIGGEFDKNGNFYFADGINSNRIRKIDVSGIITTVGGNGLGGFSGDNIAATASKLYFPNGVRVDSSGNLYIADAQNNRIRKISQATGIITTIAGNGTAGFGGDDGPATAAMLRNPNDICFDKLGNLYIADLSNFRIRKVDTAGIITTFAGSGGVGPIGDGGMATDAVLNVPQGLASDHIGNIYIADASLNRVRKVTTTGIITTIAGNGTYTYIGDNIPATDAQINPTKLCFDYNGQLFIADNANMRVYKIDNLGLLHLVAGNGSSGFNGDGFSATATSLDYPAGIAFDLCGNMYIPEPSNRRIRKIAYPPTLTIPTISITGDTNKPVGVTVTINATVSNAGSSYIIHWLNKGVEFTTTAVPSVTYTKAAGNDTITARVVSTASYGCYDSTTSAGWVVSVSGVGLSTELKVTIVSIWPNPVSNELHIDNVGVQCSYRILNIVGVELQCGILLQGSNSVDIEELPGGMYMVEVMPVPGGGYGGRSERVVKKIIKQQKL